jgi:hypothetical protein
MAQSGGEDGLRNVGRRFVPLEEQDPDPDPHKRDNSDLKLAASTGKDQWTIVCRFVSLYEEQDPDPHKRDKSDPDLAASKEKEGSGSLCFGFRNSAPDFKRWERGDRKSHYAGTEMPNRPFLE